VAYSAPEKLTLLPFPQSWNGNDITLRAVVLPRGTPMDPLMTGVASLPDSKAFADGEIRLTARLIPSLDALPDPADVTATVDVAMLSPTARRPLFDTVASQFMIDSALEAATRNPRRAGRQVNKLLTTSYTRSFAFTGPRTPYAVLGDTYACAMRRGCQLGAPAGSPPTNKTTWGQVISQCLRQPLLAQQMGLLFAADLTLPDPALFSEGGWVYLALRPDSAFADHTVAQPDLLATYAARIPPLTAPRQLFAPVLFPVTGTPPAADYDEIFGETAGYDDGFAKIVHCAQQTTSIPIGLETADDLHRGAPLPVRDTGIQLGWDDEQLLVWTNRQLADPTTETRQSPLVVRGYRVDVREQGTGTASWHSLMRVQGDLTVAGRDIGRYKGELNVEVGPLQLENQEDGNYWMPAYFTQWQGRSLVTEDTAGLKLGGSPATGGRYKPIDDTLVLLRYGRGYEFRVRLSDLSNGGPTATADPINPAPAPVATCDFRRFVPPGLPQVGGVPTPIDPANPPTTLSVSRPRLDYPAAVFTEAPNVLDRLLADAAAITASGLGDVPGIADPDVALAEIKVAVAGLRFDSANDGNGIPPLRTLYTTTRPFPADPDDPLELSLDWVDIHDATTLAPTAAGSLAIPRAREVTVTVRAVGKNDPDLDYFGSDEARFGDETSVVLHAAGKDERTFFVPDVPARQLRCVLLRGQEKETRALLVRLKATGRKDEADTSPLHLLAEELDLEASGRALWAKPGQRVIFACSKSLAYTLSPDGSAITFSSEADLTDRWLTVLTVAVDRDWTWRGADRIAVEVKRQGEGVVGGIMLARSVNPEVFQSPERAGVSVDRATTRLVFFDAVEPKPTPPDHPQELTLRYALTPQFGIAPAEADAPLELEVDLPIATPPSQTPSLVSAGIVSSSYERADDYSSTEPRERMLWLEFAERPDNPADTCFARVLSCAPDPMLTRESDVSVQPEPPLPIAPEYIRVIRPGQADDSAGLNAMQKLLPTDSPQHFLLPLPPGLSRDSRELHGFFVYELRLGHYKGWSTARGRFGPPLRVTGVQHPSPTLSCQAFRTPGGILASAPFVTPVFEGRSLLPSAPATTVWVVLYAQVTQADGADRRNILLSRKEARFRRKKEGRRDAVEPSGDTRWSQSEIELALDSFGLPHESSLSVLALELLPEVNKAADPLGGDLGSTRVLRTSPLVRVPPVCIHPPCPAP